MRNIWDTKRGFMKGLITAPKKLKSAGVKRLMEDALWAQGLRAKLELGKRRHEFQTDHGFRKWFKTRCELAGMKPINIEKLMNHSTGISDSYYRATENDVLEDYMKAVDMLSINNDKLILQKQVAELTERNKEENYIIKGKLSEKDEEIRSMREELSSMRSQVNDVLEVLKIAKSKDGTVGKDRTMLDENRRVTFGYVDNNNQIVEVKIPLDGVQINEVHARSTTE